MRREMKLIAGCGEVWQQGGCSNPPSVRLSRSSGGTSTGCISCHKENLFSIQADVTIQVQSFCNQIFSGVIRRANVYNKVVRITFNFHRQSTV